MGKQVKRPLLCCPGSSQNAAWDCGTPGVNGLNELCSSNGFPKKYRLSYTAYLHNLDAIYVCVPFLFPCVCVCTHIRARLLLSPDVLTALTAIPANGQIQEITPRCRHKASRKAPILPPDAGPRQEKQPQARLHNALSSFCPTNT